MSTSNSRADAVWGELSAYGDTYTCYSAAIATWVAIADERWPAIVEPGLALTLTDGPGGLFGFAHFPAGMRARLGLVRTGSDDPAAAIEGVLGELRRSGRVIVAGDGFNLPWHVAHGRAHVPHWFVLVDGPEGPEVGDPFACRNELGVQSEHREVVSATTLNDLLTAPPSEDPVQRLRESLAFGDVADVDAGRHQWFGHEQIGEWRTPAGASGADAVLRLARHFREDGQDPAAYTQADDIWSIARHRAFLCRHAESHDDTDVLSWLEEHGLPLAKRWSHMAPLLMQARLALSAGRPASASVPDKLEELAARERAAADAFPIGLRAGSI
ncbi:MAG: hypothetical protein LC685_00505 [Actinobacteria bacterium]|nr:hypothetical protein [Actinomycetota bacterium]